MELAKLPVLALLVVLAIATADAAMYLQRVTVISSRKTPNKTHHFVDERLQVHGFSPDGYRTKYLCEPRGKPKLYGIVNVKHEAKVWVHYPCRGNFFASFSSFKRLEAHPDPIGVVGTPLSMEMVTILTTPFNKDMHSRKKVLLKTKTYPSSMFVSRPSDYSQHCKKGETFGISQSRWKAEVWAIWPCKATFGVSFDAKYPLSPVPKRGEEQQICQLELVMTGDKDSTKKMDGEVVSVELSRKFRGNGCDTLNRHFRIKSDTFTVMYQYHCVAYFKVCYKDSPRVCTDVSVDNKNNKPLVKEMPGLIVALSLKKAFNPGQRCASSSRTVKDNVFSVSSTGCSGTYNICYVTRIAEPINPVCTPPKDDSIECKVVKDVMSGRHPTQIVKEAQQITCATLISETSKNRCNCPVTGDPKYNFFQNKINIHVPLCRGDFFVCYKKYSHKAPECPAKGEEEDNVCIDTVVQPGKAVPIHQASSISCMRFVRNLYSSRMKVECFKKSNGKDIPLFTGVTYKGVAYARTLTRNCGGIFKVCYKPECKFPYKNVNGKCIAVEKRSSRNFVEAATKCNSMGGKLMNIKQPFTYFEKMKNHPDFKDRSFFIGGSTIFEDATRSPGASVPKPPTLKNTPVILPKIPFMPIKNWHKIKELLKIQDKSHSSILQIIRRYTGYPLPQDLIRDSPYTDRCLTMDFGHEGPDFVSCHDKQHYICEQSFKNSRGAKWSPWINLDNRTTFQIESLAHLKQLHREGQLNLEPLTFCNKPVYMECRNAEHPKIRYNPYFNRGGENFEPNCRNDTFICDAKKTVNKKCPDVEIRFACPPSAALTCRNVLVKDNCEHQNKDCVDTSFGPKCVEKVIKHTGKEVIGERTCNFNNKEYVMKECVSRGDPSLRTFDGLKINQFKSNAGSYVLFDSKSIHVENPIPDVRVVVHNSPLKSYVNARRTRGFDLTINGTTYSFKSNAVFEIDGLKKSYIDFSDDNIEIDVQNKGGKGMPTPKITIDTKFCMQIVSDSRMSISVRLPAEFKTIKTGLCGNFNGDKTDDLVLEKGKRPVKQIDFTSYHMVSSDKKACLDCEDKPRPCSKSEAVKYMSQKYCGVFNPRATKSPLVKYLRTTKNPKENMAQLEKIFADCLENHCRIKRYYQPCHEIETHVEEIMKDLKVKDMKTLDEQIRKFTSCTKHESTKCDKNSHYDPAFWVKCQATCGTTTSSVDCGNQRASGCVCDKGYYLDANMKCVSSDECAKDCTVDLDSGESFSVKNGKTVVVEACERTVTCVNGDLIEKKTEPCSMHANCAKEGTECQCREGFKGDGRSCDVDRTCKFGFMAVGDMCYKYMTKPTLWYSAAQICGQYGARLARYDNAQNMYNLEYMMRSSLKIKTYAKATTRKLYCRPNSRCRIPNNEHAAAIKRPSLCKENRATVADQSRYLITTSKCYGIFYIKTLKRDDYISYIKPKITPWVGGNTEVIGFGKRKGKAPFSVDPPRLIDPSTESDLGCYYATLNQDKKLVLRLNRDCLEGHEYICEYDNHVVTTRGDTDIIGLPRKVNYEEGQRLCKQLGRPMLTILNLHQQEKVNQIISREIRSDAWVDAKFYYEKPYYIARWSDGNPLSFRYFRTHPSPKNSRKQLTLCLFVSKINGYWMSAKCAEKKYTLCGPPKQAMPTAYTPPFVVPSASSMANVKTAMKNRGISTPVCSNPVDMKCRALRQGENGAYVTNIDQPGNTITCTKEEISCKDGQGLDCRTLEVQMLCPQTNDQCAALKKIGVTPCHSGMKCFPTENAFNCLCPAGTQYNQISRTCKNADAWCSAWGDPHYTTFGGSKFDFMGSCKYLFAGSCKPSSELTAPHFNIYTKNVECGKQGTCLSKVEIHLRNANVLRMAKNVRIARNGDFIFKVNVGDSSYKLNGKDMEQTSYAVPGAFTITLKKAYFELNTRIGLKLTLSGSRLDVYAPEKPLFEMCGLCQKPHHALGRITLLNGTNVNVRLDKKRRADPQQMAAIAASFAVSDPEAIDEKCDGPVEAPKPCTKQVQSEIEAPNMCGVFANKDSPLKDCFEKINPAEFYDDCKFDACAQANRTEAVCAMAKAYAHACIKLGVIMAWRNEDFCPMECGKKEVWRADASCEPECGVEQTGTCEESPEEGCVCRPGYLRQGSECLPVEKCGCEVYMCDGSILNLAIGKSLLMPECTEEVTCEINNEGEPDAVYARFSLPQNGICHNGPPTTVECAKGFGKKGDDCERIPGGCKDGFDESEGMCLSKPDVESIWRHAIQECSVKDASLPIVDTESKLNEIAKMMISQKMKSIYIAGRVKAVVDKNRQIKLEPLVKEEDSGKVEFVNFDTPKYVLSIAVPSSDMTIQNMEHSGSFLSLVVRLSEGNEAIIVAVPPTTKANFVCEERDIKPESAEWRPACNSDNNMKDEGDQEYLKNMLLNSKCSVCPVPLDVRCVPEGNPGPDQTEKGKCGLNKEGLLYNCEEGEKCIDMAVETLCAKDIDECALELHDCGRESTCVNTVGAYKCRCLKEQYPMMIDGFCQESRTCSLSGPQIKNGYTFNFTGFEGVPGVFSYDCSYLMAAPRKSSYTREMKVPYVDFALVQDRSQDGLKMKMMGTIYSPQGRTPKAWMINEELLKEKMFMYGQDEHMVKHELNYVSKLTGTKFIYKNPGVMMIIGLDNHYKARITMEPFSFQLEVSGQLANIMDGVCTLAPEVPGNNVFMSPKESEDISVGITRCKPFIEPPLPMPVPPTQRPPVRPTIPQPPQPIVPTTYGFPGGAPVAVPDRPPVDAILPVEEPQESEIYVPTVKVYEPAAPVVVDSPVDIEPDVEPIVADSPAIPIPDGPIVPLDPRPTPICDGTTFEFCNVVAQACNIPQEQCLSVLCTGEQCKCSYLAKEKFKYCNQTQTLGIVIDELGCVEDCDENERFGYSVASKQPTCSNPEILPVEGEDAVDEWEFGCYCEQGFVLSGGDCVRKQECGCVLNDGSYVKPFTQWRQDDCRVLYQCQPGGEIIAFPEQCGPNTECVETEDGHKCECEEGFFGNPEMKEGCEKGKPDVDGSKICYNYTNSDGSIEERCNCSLGFISNCNDCEDMDECKLGLHDCDLSEEKCINIPGGYECGCADGFKLKNDECVDVDECKESKNPCGKNAGCINSHGSYKCECCAGWEMNTETGNCERDEAEFPAVPKNVQCCHICNIPQICEKSTSEKYSINYCYLFANGDLIDFPSGEVLFKYLCMKGLEFNANDAKAKNCSDIPPEVEIDPSEQINLWASIRMVGVEFDKQKYGSLDTPEAAALVKVVEDKVNAGLKKRLPDFVTANVVQFRNGSIIADLELVVAGTEDQIKQKEVEVKSALEDWVQISSLNLDKKYVVVSSEAVIATTMPFTTTRRTTPTPTMTTTTAHPTRIPTTIPRMPTTIKYYKDTMEDIYGPGYTRTRRPTTARTTVPYYTVATTTFPTSCEAEDLMYHLPQPASGLRTGPVCGPLNSRNPETHKSYADMVRSVCRQVGGPNNLPRGSAIFSFSGPCPTPEPIPTMKTTTYGAPMRPPTTTLGAPMRPPTTTLPIPTRPPTTTLPIPTRRSTLGAPMRPPTTTYGAPMRPPTTTLGAPMRPPTTTLGAPMRPPTTTLPIPTRRSTTTLGAPMRPRTTVPFITTTTTRRPPTTRVPVPTRPMTTYGRPIRTTTYEIHEDPIDMFRTTRMPTTQRSTTHYTTPYYTFPTERPTRRTTEPYTTMTTGHRITTRRTTEPYQTYPTETTMTTGHRITTRRTTEPYQTYPTEIPTTEPYVTYPTERHTTEPFVTYPTEKPFPEGECEVPPVTATDATPDTPVLYEISFNAVRAPAQFKIFGTKNSEVPFILKPSTDLLTSPTFNPTQVKAIVASLPKGSKMEIPSDVQEVISMLNPNKDYVHTYLYRSYEGVFRIVAVFKVDRQAGYSNIFKESSIPLQIYDVVPYQGEDDVHNEEGPIIVSAHMGVRIALDSVVMCGGAVPTVPQPTTPPVRGCHSDYTGNTYRHGESWSEGDCSNCTCDNGFSACYVMDCFLHDCEHQQDVPGQCCHECLDVEPPTPTPDFTPWTQWSKCYFKYGHNHCGIGYQYRERDVDNSNSRVRYEPKRDEIYEDRSCFEACEDEDGNIDTTKCASEAICDFPDPVCGSTEPGPTTTFKSECELNVKACQKGNMPIKLYSGMCNPEDDIPANQMCERDGPIRTSVKYEYEDEHEECFGPVTDIKTCSSLLCKGGSKTCCKATSYEPIEVSVSCYSVKPREFLRFKKHVHYSATACECQDDGK